MGDNKAILQGYTRQVIAKGREFDLYLLVKPDTDFDGQFKTYDTDNQEFIRVNGWLFTFEDAE